MTDQRTTIRKRGRAKATPTSAMDIASTLLGPPNRPVQTRGLRQRPMTGDDVEELQRLLWAMYWKRYDVVTQQQHARVLLRGEPHEIFSDERFPLDEQMARGLRGLRKGETSRDFEWGRLRATLSQLSRLGWRQVWDGREEP